MTAVLMANKRFTVYCTCGWKGRRVINWDLCACYDLCECSWGNCPKCKAKVSRISPNQVKQEIDKADAWCASPEGQAALAKLQ